MVVFTLALSQSVAESGSVRVIEQLQCRATRMGVEASKAKKSGHFHTGDDAVDALHSLQKWIHDTPLYVRVHCEHLPQQDGPVHGFLAAFWDRYDRAMSHFTIECIKAENHEFMFSVERRPDGICFSRDWKEGTVKQATVIEELRHFTIAEVIEFVQTQRHRPYSFFHNNCKHFVYWFREFLHGRLMFNNEGFDFTPGEMAWISECIEDAWVNG